MDRFELKQAEYSIINNNTINQAVQVRTVIVDKLYRRKFEYFHDIYVVTISEAKEFIDNIVSFAIEDYLERNRDHAVEDKDFWEEWNMLRQYRSQQLCDFEKRIDEELNGDG